MLTVRIPEDTSQVSRAFLHGWSICMQAMLYMTDDDKRQIEKLFKKHIEPEAQCPEGKALDSALMAYLMHECGAPEGIGSAVKKKTKKS